MFNNILDIAAFNVTYGICGMKRNINISTEQQSFAFSRPVLCLRVLIADQACCQNAHNIPLPSR